MNPISPLPKKEFPSPSFGVQETTAPKNQEEQRSLEVREQEKVPGGQETSVQQEPAPTLEKRRLLLIKKKTPPPLPPPRDALTKEVEHILEEGLEEAFRALPPMEREKFKLKGEETARAIRDMLRGTKVAIKKMFLLILEWLALLPGINRFFLEQEAKIKTDKLMALKRLRR